MLRIRKPGLVKNKDPDTGPGSGMDIPDHISESLETILWVKILDFFDADLDPGSEIFSTLDPGWKISRIRNTCHISHLLYGITLPLSAF